MDCIAASSADVVQAVDVLFWAVCLAVVASHVLGALGAEAVRQMKLAWQEWQREREGF